MAIVRVAGKGSASPVVWPAAVRATYSLEMLKDLQFAGTGFKKT
jgi:hypothetical protein